MGTEIEFEHTGTGSAIEIETDEGGEYEHEIEKGGEVELEQLWLPESIDAEHRRYIQEVFTRLNAEVKAEHWETVDAYIDSMIKYQCQFGGSPPSQSPSSYTIIAIFLGMSLACLAACKVS